ncbi:Type IV pilus biogenesis protein PilQ [hydrothermal vent metagenome]|uniref:Type IV pilus biogenesis protein PilQ n=1 Tax=hydrothermal vent metagenome TaxID=652676 RepID=A0A3B1BEJ2_9ZZZZ
MKTIRTILFLAFAFSCPACVTADKKPIKVSLPTYTIEQPVQTGRGPLPPEFTLKNGFAKNASAQIKTQARIAPPEVVVSFKKAGLQNKTPETKISINLKGASIEDAIRTLQKVSGVNFVVAQGAKQAQTADMILRNVTWLDALKTITRASNLVATQNGDAIFRGGTLMKTPRHGSVLVITTYDDQMKNLENRKKTATSTVEIILKERKIREEKSASARFSDNLEMLTKSHRFKYADPEEALRYLERLFTNYEKETLRRANMGTDIAGALTRNGERNDTKWLLNTNRAKSRNAVTLQKKATSLDVRFSLYKAENLITITAPSGKIGKIMNAIKEIDVAPRQVYIIARIVEVQRNFVKDIGVQWGGYATRTVDYKFPHVVGISGASGANAVSLPPQSAVDPATGALISNPQGGAIGLTLGSVSGATLLNAKLFALEKAGVSRTVSNPKVLAINGKQAYIKSGREIPYQSSSANTGVNIRFKEAVISLSVTPFIMEDNRIRMKIKAKKDEVDTALSVQGVPSIKKKELVTSVVVENGGSVVLGGVSEGLEGGYQNRTPWLHKIPGLGWLFKNDRKTDNELELLIFITPTIVNGEAG